ncbi:MAG: GNAT family N-acetyltransferase [Oscillospiraceae bacterium]|nr:GNAT family N-acetyltransferase [Oscillospiraceae bacterium]
MKTAVFTHLPEDAALIRREVFIEEQGFINEFDDIDEKAVHILMYDNDTPAAVCRVFYSEEHGQYVIGRIAVRREFRGKHLGAEIMRSAEDEIRKLGGHTAGLSSQVQAMGFYEKQGYRPVGEQYMDEHCPHIRMEKELL